MRRGPWLLALLVTPVLAWPEYDPGAIKRGVTERERAFQVEGWRQSDNGEAWIAETRLSNVVLSVGESGSGIIAVLQSSEQAVPAMLRCLMFGLIGLSPEDEAQRERISGTIQSAVTSQSSKSLHINDVTLEVTPRQVGGNVTLSCMLSPSQ